MTDKQTLNPLFQENPMNAICPERYFRIVDTCVSIKQLSSYDEVNLPEALIENVRPGDGLVIASWNEANQWGQVLHLCVVLSVSLDSSRVNVTTADVNIIFKPNPSGRRWWRNEHFKFAKSVQVMLIHGFI